MDRKRRKMEIPWGDAADVEALKARLAELEEKQAAAEAAAAAANDELLRRAADLDNTRKRLTRDYERSCAAAARGIVEKLLPVLDDLTRAIDAADADEAVPQHHVDSIRMLDRKIYDVLRNEGLEAIPASRGDPFDPEVHEAVLATRDSELPPDVIARVVSPGYKFKGVLLKPVKVEVCVARDTGTGQGGAPPEGVEERDAEI
ncbi:MAG: nucleotide exchange factor GrpE [bacterium]